MIEEACKSELDGLERKLFGSNRKALYKKMEIKDSLNQGSGRNLPSTGKWFSKTSSFGSRFLID
ncbi:hypothetical protein CH373_10210 [Leptospira perolatii]|uniref:Uncharacterized protein n=1 Tax=Leptospira perolatii TaxID=2023191 RepID=A0A2M9ZN24_9LEPT|nr:hypothetical protein CH360_07955 [Leptospira perolatii]PJZ73333.1 hypothetical protein CH373_10210 [Leptospira perolatii]